MSEATSLARQMVNIFLYVMVIALGVSSSGILAYFLL
jgi:hypothetical protein